MIDDEHYLDPRSGNSFAFDHFHQVIIMYKKNYTKMITLLILFPFFFFFFFFFFFLISNNKES